MFDKLKERETERIRRIAAHVDKATPDDVRFLLLRLHALEMDNAQLRKDIKAIYDSMNGG